MRVVFLAGAEEDLQTIRHYVVKNFGSSVWLDTKARLRQSVDTIKTFPLGGSVPEELADLGLDQYRQVISGMNRLIYEVMDDMICIHVVCDVRRDMRTLLTQRLLRSPR